MSKSAPDPRLVFLDLETTGLDPNRDSILELGFIVVTGTTLSNMAQSGWLVEPPWAHPEGARRKLGDYVFDMHTKSGLLHDLREEHFKLVQVERAACETLHRLGFEYGKATLAGYCPQFDHSFLKVHMPTLAGWFDYRHVDVSTLRGLMRRWLGPEIDAYSKAHGETKHRALDDCREAISELAFYKQFIDLDGMRKAVML